jgi:NADH dehydrogenase (ubiquinone) Fe-S protein 3
MSTSVRRLLLHAPKRMLSSPVAFDPAKGARWYETHYEMRSIKYHTRLRLNCLHSEDESLPSLTPLFNGCNWLEREMYDMYGIMFHEHPDLRRILTDYGMKDHPLRKDYPLSGYTEVRYDVDKKRVVIDDLELSQEFRMPDLTNTWRK